MMDFIPSSAKTIIVAPLNWGLGHATRCMPIIKALIEHNKKVIIASDGEALELLQQEFPEVLTATLPGYKVSYKAESLAKIVIQNSRNIARAIWREKKSAKRLVEQHKADLIVSDSRFGFRDPSIHNVIISHQLYPQADSWLLKNLLEKGNRYFLNQFQECWIPDSVDRKLSGILSTNSKIHNQRFIGPLSRLRNEPTDNLKKVWDVTLVLSGPEPARTKLETALVEALAMSNQKICLVRGTNNKTNDTTYPHSWQIYDRLASADILAILSASNIIISRSGYTSIMDYAQLGLSAYLVPTPGQSEQEYLAAYLDGKHGFIWLKNFDLLKSW